jgi:hypothetical protein
MRRRILPRSDLMSGHHRIHATGVPHLQRRCFMPGAVGAVHRGLAGARHREDAKHEHDSSYQRT